MRTYLTESLGFFILYIITYVNAKFNYFTLNINKQFFTIKNDLDFLFKNIH